MCGCLRERLHLRVPVDACVCACGCGSCEGAHVPVCA